MNDITKVDHSPVTPEGREALANELYAKALSLKKEVETSFLALGRIIQRLYEDKLYNELGYTDFKDFCEEALEIKWRWAFFLREILKHQKKLGLSDDECATVGVKKLGLILPRVDNGEAARGWLEKAREMTSDSLRTALKGGGASKDNQAVPERAKRFIFDIYNQEDVETIERALEVARTMTQSEYLGVYLVAMADEFRASYEAESDSQDWTKDRIVLSRLGVIERTYGVKVGEVTDTQSGEILKGSA